MQIFRNHALLILSLLLAVLISFGYTSFSSFYENAVFEQSRELSLLSNVLQNHVDNIIHNITSLSVDSTVQKTLEKSTSNDFHLTIPNRNALYRVALQTFPTQQAFYCVDFLCGNDQPYGIRSYSSDEVDNLIASKDFKTYLRNTRKASVMGFYSVETNPFVSNPQYMLLIAKPILMLDTGKYCGAILGFVQEKKLQEIYSENVPDNGTILFLLDNNQMICSTSDESIMRSNINDCFKKQESILGTLYTRTGTTYLMFDTTIHKYGWTLCSAVPINAVLHGIAKLANLLIAVGIIGISISLIFAYEISKHITTPIENLSNIIQSIEQGNLSARATITDDNEVGVLCRGFNQLMDEQVLLLKRTKEAKDLNDEYRFQLFQAQIKPHFLYNSLEAIISLIQLDLKDNAIHSLHHLSEFYQLSLNNGEEVIPLSQEIRIVEDYLSVQKTRYLEFFDYEINVNTDVSGYTIPKLTLQPIVENSIYHGIKCKHCFGHIKIVISDENKHIKLSVLDDGIGIPEHKISTLLSSANKQNFGLASILNRLKLLFGDDCSLTIRSKENEYTEVIICIPKEEQSI